MKKFLITAVVSVMAIGLSFAQPMPNQNVHNNPAATTSAPTQNSISTLSVDHNEAAMIGLSLIVVSAIFLIGSKRRVKA